MAVQRCTPDPFFAHAVCGLLLLILAVSAYQLVTHRLVTQALDDAHHLSKNSGMSVYDRLQFIADGPAACRPPVSRSGTPPPDPHRA